MKTYFKKAATAAGVSASAAALAMSCPAYAFASEGGISAILPKMDEFIPMLVAFIVLWVILAKFGWPLFDGILVKREESIKDALQKAEEARIESERQLAVYRSQQEHAHQQTIKTVAEAKAAGEALREEITAKAQAEADLIVFRAKQAIEAEKKAAIAELQGKTTDLTIGVVAKIVGEDFSDEEHRRLIERQIAKAGNFDV